MSRKLLTFGSVCFCVDLKIDTTTISVVSNLRCNQQWEEHFETLQLPRCISHTFALNSVTITEFVRLFHRNIFVSVVGMLKLS